MNINVLDYLEHSAGIKPEKVAFADSTSGITFRHVLRRAQYLGTRITDQINGQRNRPIGVFIDREVSCIPAFLGAVYSGNFYVPFDRTLPLARLKIMSDTLQPVAFMGRTTDHELLNSIGFGGGWIEYDSEVPDHFPTEVLSKVRSKSIDTDPVYAIFTSGSTGIPKCVVVSHRSVIDLVEQFSMIFGFDDDMVFGNQAPFDFDVSVKDIYSTLRNGSRMEIIPKEKFSFPAELIHYLNDREINTLIWSTSALRLVANLKGLEKGLPRFVHTVMFSGEVMPNKILNYWRKYLSKARFVNLYGPTEITCNCSYYLVDQPYQDEDALPIGVPFPNTDILILNEKNAMAEPGEKGEICVRGSSLALGYYNNPTETQRAFCQNPLNPYFNDLVYRTGDIGWRDERGILFFGSRKDNQIKHMGHRIELGEVELAVNAIDLIEAGCCIHDEQTDKIVLFYQADQKSDAEILEKLKIILPRYMLPNKLIHFKSLPLNKNGKIDRNSLRASFIDAKSK